MTVSSTVIDKTYNPGSGSLPQSLAGLVFQDPSHLVVEHIAADTGAITLLTLDVGYSLTGDGATGSASITALADYPAGDQFRVYRKTPRLQPEDFRGDQGFNVTTLESLLDTIVLIDQEDEGDARRAITVPRGEAGFELEPVLSRANNFLRFNAAGDPLSVGLAELAVLLAPEKAAGTTLAFTELAGPRSQAVIFDPLGIGEGGYWVEVSAQAPTSYERAYAKVLGGSGTCDVAVLAGGDPVWTAEGLGAGAVDEVVAITLAQGADLIVQVTNITGSVTGLIVKLEGAAA